MRKLMIIISLGFWVVGCDSKEEGMEATEPELIAEAKLFGLIQVGERSYETEIEKEIGTATFFQNGTVVTLEIRLRNMVPLTSKAVHIHEGTPEEPGRHWNAGRFIAQCNTKSIGQPWARPFIGDVGNVDINEFGNGFFSISTDLWALNSGDEFDILDHPIIIHERAQDFIEECDRNHDHTHAHNNPKIGGGTISLVSDVAKNTQSIVISEQMPDFLICK